AFAFQHRTSARDSRHAPYVPAPQGQRADRVGSAAGSRGRLPHRFPVRPVPDNRLLILRDRAHAGWRAAPADPALPEVAQLVTLGLSARWLERLQNRALRVGDGAWGGVPSFEAIRRRALSPHCRGLALSCNLAERRAVRAIGSQSTESCSRR